MDIVTLPDLFKEMKPASEQGPITTYDYVSRQAVHKCKVALNANLFSFLQEGTKVVNHHAGAEVLQPDRFLMMRAGNCLMTEQLSDQRHYRSILLFFDSNVLAEIAVKHGIQSGPRLEERDYFSLPSDPFIQGFTTSLSFLQRNGRAIPSALLLVKLEELMLYLAETHGPEAVTFFLDHGRSRREINFRNSMERNVESKLTVEELAFLCSMSPSTFKRRFKETYGMPPSRWFLEKRLEQAGYLLRVERRKPSEIYHEAGFENLSSFTQAFKKHYGLTPGKYQAVEI